MSDDSENVYCETRLEKYLQGPSQLERLTYLDLFRWWDLATYCSRKPLMLLPYNVTHQGTDDFASFMAASRYSRSSEHTLSQLLNDTTCTHENGDDILALVKSMRYPKL